MNEVVWSHPPEAEQYGLHGLWPNVTAKLPYMVRVVVLLLWQRDDQYKIGLP